MPVSFLIYMGLGVFCEIVPRPGPEAPRHPYTGQTLLVTCVCRAEEREGICGKEIIFFFFRTLVFVYTGIRNARKLASGSMVCEWWSAFSGVRC